MELKDFKPYQAVSGQHCDGAEFSAGTFAFEREPLGNVYDDAMCASSANRLELDTSNGVPAEKFTNPIHSRIKMCAFYQSS